MASILIYREKEGMNPFLGFVFLFLTLQNVFMYPEITLYGDILSEIQDERVNVIPNGVPTFKFMFAYFFIYACCLTLIYVFLLSRKASIPEAFLLGASIYAVADTFIYGVFKRTNVNHIPTLLYDILIVGGLNFALMTYIFFNYPSILSSYAPLFVLTFFVTFGIDLHKVYLYGNKINEKE